MRSIENLDRTSSLGGTDIAGILGLHQYKSALDVWMEKSQKVVPVVDNHFVEWGLRLEDSIRLKYESDNACDVHVPPPIRHKDFSFIHASPDGICYDEHVSSALCDIEPVADPWGLEIKNVGIHSAPRWGEGGTPVLPKEHEIQCRWYMMVTEIERWDIACLIGGNDYRVKTLYRDRELEDRILDTARAFWADHVVTGIEPPPQACEAYSKSIKLFYPDDTGVVEEAGDDVVELIARAAELRAKMAPHQAEYKDIQALLRGHLSEVDKLTTDDSGYVSYKRPKAKPVTDWASVALELAEEKGAVDRLDYLAKKYTTHKQGARRLNIYFPKER